MEATATENQVKIITNNQWRNFLYGYEVPESVKKDQFEHLSEDEKDCGTFLKYRGRYYHLSDFMSLHNRTHCPNPSECFKGWDGYNSDSYFSGVLIKIEDSGDQYKIGLYLS